MELEARISAATLHVLGIGNINDTPDESKLPTGLDKQPKSVKRKFLNKLSAEIVDHYILKIDTIQQYLKSKRRQKMVSMFFFEAVDLH